MLGGEDPVELLVSLALIELAVEHAERRDKQMAVKIANAVGELLK